MARPAHLQRAQDVLAEGGQLAVRPVLDAMFLQLLRAIGSAAQWAEGLTRCHALPQ